jgi:hypothetical protein
VTASIIHLNDELPTLRPPPRPFEKYVEYPGAHQMKPMILRTKPDEEWVNLEVYMDDFLAHTQCTEAIQQIKRAILNGVHSVFPEPEVSGQTQGKHPINAKKEAKGAGQWMIVKKSLGWILDGQQRNIELPPKKSAEYIAHLERALRKSRISFHNFRCILGCLRRAGFAITGTFGMVTPLNQAFKGEPKWIGVSKRSEVHPCERTVPNINGLLCVL